MGGIKFAPVDTDEHDMADYKTVSYCIEQLNRKHDRPLFLACGLHKPHMAWNVPRKYYDLFPLESIELPKVLETDLDDIPPAGVQMAKPEGDHAKMLESGRWKEAVRGYLAAGAYCDAMIGRLLEGFDRSARSETTRSSSFGATTAGTWAKSSIGASLRCGKKRRAPRCSSSFPV